MTSLLVLEASDRAFKDQEYHLGSRVKTSNKTLESTSITQLIAS